ncbi:SPW repeat protein [Spirosoma soli]|uniref:SPW repeat protein n=1 Tax=Spirosoma soli TaxID=1770529 RepID=A0ABW5M0B6_9BACT
MRFISTKVHGVLDYLAGALIIASPWLFGFADGSSAQWVPVVTGVVLLLLSICTDYEAGPVKAFSMSFHLSMDVLAGILLAASPWLFGFADDVYMPHVILGILEIGAGLMTEKVPYRHGHHGVQTGV